MIAGKIVLSMSAAKSTLDRRCQLGYHDWAFNERTGKGDCRRKGCTATIDTRARAH